MQDQMSLCPYIAFEGPIAAGKTTLATLLAAHISSDLLLEDFEGNEFLADFYSNRPLVVTYAALVPIRQNSTVEIDPANCRPGERCQLYIPERPSLCATSSQRSGTSPI